uniref:Uncharacterized protein n=1 Tax=Oryza brachyantha TaxID=4533 RepID=J3MTS4_ORYBR
KFCQKQAIFHPLNYAWIKNLEVLIESFISSESFIYSLRVLIRDNQFSFLSVLICFGIIRNRTLFVGTEAVLVYMSN